MRKVTIAEISAHTGLSRGTVSRAMNNRREISEATRQRVLQACAELKYVPSQTARALATGRHFCILVLVDTLGCVGGGAYLRGVLRRAEAEQYAVTVAELKPGEAGRTRLELITYERIDALLFTMPAQADWGPVLAAMERRAVILPTELESFSCDTCAPDLAAAGRLAAEVGQRSDRPPLFVGDLRNPVATALHDGLETAARAQGARPVVFDTAGRPLREWLGEGILAAKLEHVEVVVCDSDETAHELLLLAPRLGRVVGRDLAVLGYGDEPRSARGYPSLSSIDPCLEEVGSQAMSAALQRLSQDTLGPPTTIRIKPRLKLRESTSQLLPPDS